MTLTNPERLILHLLLDMREKLKVADEMDEFVSSALFDDKLWALPLKYHGLLTNEPMLEEVKYVYDVLDMWSDIESSISKLDEASKEQIEDAVGHWKEFKGFDGNHETEYLSIARFVIDKMNHWSEFKGRNLNSHRNTEGQYRKMLSLYNEMSIERRVDLTTEEVIHILS